MADGSGADEGDVRPEGTESRAYLGWVIVVLFFIQLFSIMDRLVLSVLGNSFSRRHEFEADTFAADSTGSATIQRAGGSRTSCNARPRPSILTPPTCSQNSTARITGG